MLRTQVYRTLQSASAEYRSADKCNENQKGRKSKD